MTVRPTAAPAVYWLLLSLLIAGCRGATPTPTPPSTADQPPPLATKAVVPASPTPTPTLTATLPPPSATPTASAAPTRTPTATPWPTSTATPDPYAGLTIDALAARSYGGGLLEIVDKLEENEHFARYLITYPSDRLTIYGYMNVPHEGDRFPVALVLHGYIPPSEYETVAYTRRYSDALARAGYFVIHPNFRNYPPSDSGPDPFRTGYAIDVLNLVAIIREQSLDPLGTLRRVDAERIHMMGHSMGGGVALRVLTVNPAPYLRTAVLYASMSGDEALNYGRIRRWSGGRSGRFELDTPPATLAAISPINYLDRLQAAISIHHSEADEVVPFAWSEDLCRRLQRLDHPVECFTYWLQPHTFRGDADELFMERMIAFFGRWN